MNKKNGTVKLLAGLGLGAALGILFAPQSGEKTRRELKNKCSLMIKNLKEIDYSEVKDNLIERVQSLQDELADLDKEKVLEIAKIKAEAIQKQAEDLYKEAIKQGKPIIEKTAKDIKNKTIEVLKDVVDKLENSETPVKKVTKKN